MRSGRYGARGKGINGYQLELIEQAVERRQEAERAPERVAQRKQVRRLQLEFRVSTEGSPFYSPEQIAAARAALAQMDNTDN